MKTIMMLLIFTIASCGSNDTTLSSSSALSAAVNSEISALKAQYSCTGRFDINFYTSNVTSDTTVNGPFSPGLASDTAYETYVGLSVFNDLMIVTRTSAGFNVTLSMCPYESILNTSRTYSQFYADNGIILYQHTTSTIGSIDASIRTILIADSAVIGGLTYDPAQVITTFFRIE